MSQAKPMVLGSPNHQKSLIFLVLLSKSKVWAIKKIKKIKKNKKNLENPDLQALAAGWLAAADWLPSSILTEIPLGESLRLSQ